jgi:hypothetical protein
MPNVARSQDREVPPLRWKVRTIDEMFGRRSIRPSVVLGLALGGVLLGHTLAYRIILPDAHARALELARSGHGYLAGANAVGLVASIVALSVLFLGRLLRSEDAATWSIVWRLVAFQMAAFASMEILERVASGSGAGRLLPVLAIGLPVQALVAGAIALIARFMLRAAEVFAGRVSGRAAWPRADIAYPRFPYDVAPATRAIVDPPPERAPPSVPVPA